MEELVRSSLAVSFIIDLILLGLILVLFYFHAKERAE
jgi:hypothetical protein